MEILLILFGLGIVIFVIWAIMAIIGSSNSNPTLLGVVVSLMLGVLPLYLILCFFGIMGEPREK